MIVSPPGLYIGFHKWKQYFGSSTLYQHRSSPNSCNPTHHQLRDLASPLVSSSGILRSNTEFPDAVDTPVHIPTYHLRCYWLLKINEKDSKRGTQQFKRKTLDFAMERQKHPPILEPGYWQDTSPGDSHPKFTLAEPEKGSYLSWYQHEQHFAV